MYSLLSQSGQRSSGAYGVRRYVLDTPEDFQSLPTAIPMGCSAFVISTKKSYMLDGNLEWKDVTRSGGGSVNPSESDVYTAIPFSEIDSYFNSREGL